VVVGPPGGQLLLLRQAEVKCTLPPKIKHR
jgi:hypothetical protein